ncbi:ABC transporter substrate-binding protein [Xanthobacter sp. V3C-3]|uniref:ABC transporter substrate-binding protein n=1 Tax=Xanthobacter lutulentifluminis TaxID=3119935 RepID=UPI003728A4A1
MPHVTHGAAATASARPSIAKRLAAAALAATCLLSGPAAQAADPVKLGVIMPLTGGQAPFGQNSLRAIELAVERINAAGGIAGLDGAKIELVVADAASDPTTAASVAQRIISRDRVSAIICCFASSLTIAASEVAERNRTPLLGMATSDTLTTRGFKNYFQITTRASVYGAAQLDDTIALAKANGKDIKKIAVVYEDTAYGQSTAAGLLKRAKEIGMDVALSEAYPQGINDVMPLIQKIRAGNPDVVLGVSYFSDAVLLVRGMRQAGLTMPIVGAAAGYVIPEFKEALGPLANGVMSTVYANYDHYGEFGEAYRKKYGTFMTHDAFEHSALVYVVAEAMSKGKTTKPAELGPVLRTLDVTTAPVNGMPGGGAKFDETGLNSRAHPILVQWQDGELFTVWPKQDATRSVIWP